jgi:hypothetical protein
LISVSRTPPTTRKVDMRSWWKLTLLMSFLVAGGCTAAPTSSDADVQADQVRPNSSVGGTGGGMGGTLTPSSITVETSTVNSDTTTSIAPGGTIGSGGRIGTIGSGG